MNNKVGYVTEIKSSAIADSIVDFYENKKSEEFTQNVIKEKDRFKWSTFVEGVLELRGKL